MDTCLLRACRIVHMRHILAPPWYVMDRYYCLGAFLFAAVMYLLCTWAYCERVHLFRARAHARQPSTAHAHVRASHRWPPRGGLGSHRDIHAHEYAMRIWVSSGRTQAASGAYRATPHRRLISFDR